MAAKAFFVAAVTLSLSVPSLAGIDPDYAENITVYHINPQHYGPNPVNMDTGDAAGDMFFDLYIAIIDPLVCPDGAKSGHHCSNPEAIAPDLVVNELVLEVDRRYSVYAKCNIGINGTDQRGHPCKDGTYCCFCGESTCEKTLGRLNVSEHFAHRHGCKEDWECYKNAVSSKFTSANPGLWYSSLQSGYCGDNNSTEPCTWRVVEVKKIVKKECHNHVFFGAVERRNETCFKGCNGGVRNTTSPCWVRCFYDTAYGPESGIPGGKVEGMPLEDLLDAWTEPFTTDKCKDVGSK